MIHALNALSSRPYFSVLDLQRSILEAPGFPRLQNPQIYGGRFELAEEPIFIAPMSSSNQPASPVGVYRDERQDDDFLDIRLRIGRKIRTADIAQICQALEPLKRSKDLEYRHAVLLGKHGLSNFKHYWAAEMFANAIRKKRRNTLTASSPSPNTEEVAGLASSLALIAEQATLSTDNVLSTSKGVALPTTPLIRTPEPRRRSDANTVPELQDWTFTTDMNRNVGLLGGFLAVMYIELRFFRRINV